MAAIEAFKPLGALAIGLLTAGLACIVWRWPAGLDYSFSQHVARHKAAIFYYIGLFTLVLPLLLAFLLGWLAPTLRLSPVFAATIIISAIAQFSVTLVPETGGWKTRYHRPASFLSAALLIPALSSLLLSPVPGIASKAMAGASLVIMLAIIITVAAHHAQHRYLLLLQAGYFAAFFCTILLAAYGPR